MDQQIKLLVPLLLGGTNFEAGVVVEVDMEWARRIVALGQAEYVVPDPHEPHHGSRTTTTTQPPSTMQAAVDPHQQHHESAVSMPPTERAVTRHEPPGAHKKK